MFQQQTTSVARVGEHKLSNQQYFPHPYFTPQLPQSYGQLFPTSYPFQQFEQNETLVRDQIGVTPIPHTSPTEYHTLLPTSITYKISNEIEKVSSIEISNHGAYLAIGTIDGLIRLYCFGRKHENNILLQKLQLAYEGHLNGTNINQTITSTSIPNRDEISWQFLIDKGIDITAYGIQTSTITNPNLFASQNDMIDPSLSSSIPTINTNTQTDMTNNSIPYQIHELIHHQSPVSSIKFSKCLNFMISVDIKGVICLWSLTNEYSHAMKYAMGKLGGSNSNTNTTTTTGTKKLNFQKKGSTNTNTTTTKESTQSTQSSSTTTPLTTTTNQNQTIDNNISDSIFDKPSNLILNDPFNKPILLHEWISFPSTSNSIRISPRGGYFAIAHQSIGISLYRTDILQPLRLLPPIPNYTPSTIFEWSPNGCYIAIAWEQGNKVALFSLFTGRSNLLTTSQASSSAIAFTPMKILDLQNFGSITTMSFTPCGRYLLTCDTTLSIILWDIQNERKIWYIDPLRLIVNKNIYQLNPDSYIKTTLPILKLLPSQQQQLQQQSSLTTTTKFNPIYPQSDKYKGYWPLTQTGTIHTDIITSCSISYCNTAIYNHLFNNPQQQSSQLLQQDQLHPYQLIDYFPFIISTTSLDGTTKLWHPSKLAPIQPQQQSQLLQSQQYDDALCLDLKRVLLQTIYTKSNPVQLATFTSRNLLLIVTTDNDINELKSLHQAK